MTRRQALLALFGPSMAQVPKDGQPGTLILDLRRWKELVVIGSDFPDGEVRFTAAQIFAILKG